MFSTSRRAARARLALVLVVPALSVAACSGSSGSATTAQSAPTTAAGAHSAKVETHRGGPGTFLTDGSGRALYLFAADHGGRSTCTGGCASAWPPFTTNGPPTAAGQARSGLLGTTSRGGGVRQVTYAGHPLYYFAGDTSSGQTTGQGSNGFGARWWVVSPAGTAITHGNGGGSSGGGSGGGSGGSGYGSGGGY